MTFTDFLKDYIESLSLLLAAVFAGLAAWFAYRVPRNVAELAAELDLRNRENDRRSQVKLILFGTLMQERANIASREGVRALNLIDVAFFDDRGVRDAWAEYGEPIAYDAADRIELHGISPADAARVLIAVGISRLRASLPPDELKIVVVIRYKTKAAPGPRWSPGAAQPCLF